MSINTLIFTATYNEAENIIDYLKKVEQLNLNADILIIDDNSPDKTWKIIEDYSINKKNIHLIIREKKEGLDTAHKMAYEYSVTKNYKYLITMDADLTHDPEKISEILHELKSNPFVICSRYTKGGSTDIKGFRLFISYFGTKFMKFIFNMNCDEFSCAYRGYSLNELGNFNIKNISSKGYSFFMEVVYHLHNRGVFIKEIPFFAKQRSSGKSKIPNIEIFRTLFNIFRLKFKKILNF